VLVIVLGLCDELRRTMMKYVKPELFDIDVGAASGAPCNQGPFNYSQGCTSGFANSTTCASGSFDYPGPSCASFGQGAQSGCNWGWSPR
jgi:hypothetical protein